MTSRIHPEGDTHDNKGYVHENGKKEFGFLEAAQSHQETLDAGRKWRDYKKTRRRPSSMPGDSLKLSERKTISNTSKDKCHLGLDLDTDEVFYMQKSNSTPSNAQKPQLQNLNKQLIEHFISLSIAQTESDEVDLDLLESLVEQGADINCSDKYGQTIMHEVARSWHTDIAFFLCEKGADVKTPDKFGRTPLHVAAATDYPEMIDFLFKKGASLEEVTYEELQTVMHFAARNDAVESCKILKKLGADIEVRDYRGRTPVHVAAELDRSETARWLLENGADCGVIDNSGTSCMMHMITKMGPVAKDALDTFHKTDRANRKQYFFLNKLEPNHSDEYQGSLAKTPLQVIVTFKQLDIIMHPVILRLLELKWNEFGRKGAILSLVLNLLYILFWTVLAVGVPWQTRYNYIFPVDAWIVVFWILAFGMTLWYVSLEILEVIASRRKFGKWKSWREDLIDGDLRYCHPKWPEEEAYLKREKESVSDMLPGYFHDFWNYFDWIVYLLNFTVLITHFIDIGAYNNETRPAPCCLPVGCSVTAELIRNGTIGEKDSCNQGYVNNASMSVWNNRIFVLNIILLWLKLMKNTRAFRTLGPFVVMLGKITYDIVRFLYLYFEFYIPYACAFWMVFGDEESISSMSTVDNMLFSLYRITLVDDYQFDEMQAFDIVMAYFLIGTFLGISAILIINLFIALLSDTFQRVYDNANANAVMQQAILILSTEEGLTEQSQRKYKNYIRKRCSPLEEYYDDDLTASQEDNLKKVTFQIKDQMEELIELLRIDERERSEMEQLFFGKRMSPSDLSKDNSQSSSQRRFQPPVGSLKHEVTPKRQDQNMISNMMKMTTVVAETQREQEKSLSALKNDMKSIKKILQQLSGNKKKRRVQSDVSIISLGGVIPPPKFPVEITTLSRTSGPSSTRGHPPYPHFSDEEHAEEVKQKSIHEELMRKLIQSSGESQGARTTGEHIEMFDLPGTSQQPDRYVVGTTADSEGQQFRLGSDIRVRTVGVGEPKDQDKESPA